MAYLLSATLSYAKSLKNLINATEPVVRNHTFVIKLVKFGAKNIKYTN